MFGKKCFRKLNTFRFLFFLSLCDFLVLSIGASDVLISNMYQFEIRTYSRFLCKVHTYLTYTVTHMSSILLMVVSIHRAFNLMQIKIKVLRPNTERSLNQIQNLNIKEKIQMEKNKKEYVVELNSKYKFLIEFNSINKARMNHLKESRKDIVENKMFHARRRLKFKQRTLAWISSKLTVESYVLIVFIIVSLINFHYILFIDKISVKFSQNLNLFEDMLFFENKNITSTFEDIYYKTLFY